MIKFSVTGIFFLFAISILFTTCKKEEGKGGLSTIKGKVYAFDLDRLGIKVDSGYMANVKVFISYGNHTWVDDNTRTAIDGTFAFEWLNKGDYRVWIISECDTCPLNQRADMRNVRMGKKETVTLPDFIYYY
jgi:thioredoxin reductase